MILPIGFVGQGWIGRHYADDFENRGYPVVRYALEEPYLHNKASIADCPITFIAVPTPTTPAGFDESYVVSALTVIGKGHCAVIKSTTIPGLISKLQTQFPDIIILHSPEFLVEKTAAYDAAHPQRNIIGIPLETKEHRAAANAVFAALPTAPFHTIMSSLESELVKYAGNCLLYAKVVFMNILFDTVTKSGGDFAVVREALVHDPRIGDSHTQPVHDSGRGAGGHCFIKDFEALRRYYQTTVGEDAGFAMLTAQAQYNNQLLRESGKNLDILAAVYGPLSTTTED